MSQDYYNTDDRKGKHLTEQERYRIEILLQEGNTPSEIARKLDRHKRTIEREIKRGTVRLLNSDLTYREQYCADAGQRIYDENAKNKGPGLKIGKDHKLAKHIEERIIKNKYSPDAVIGEIKAKGLKFDTSICTKTLYNYIDKGVFANITNKDLPVKKYKKKGNYHKVKIAHKNLKGTSIEERPKEIETRQEYGHWEMDCVVGKQGGSGAVLLVLSERKSRQEIIIKIPSKTQEFVVKAIDALEKEHGDEFYKRFKTITVDNGSEFLDFKGLERSIISPDMQRVKIYYAHPYSAWERPTNENLNKMIRRFVAKGTDIGRLSDDEIKQIEEWMNNYPRKILGYKTPNEVAG